MGEDRFSTILFWVWWAFAAWITWFLTITDFKPPMDAIANYAFWSIALALYSAIGVVIFEDGIEDWIEWCVLGGVGVLCALYAYNVGYADGHKVTNHLLALWWGIVGTVSFGGATLATVCYGVAIRTALDKQEQQRQQKQEEEQFNAEFHDVGDDDEGFGYDEAAFSGGGSSKAESKPHRTDRHPDDLKFWRVVDDPSFSEQERSKAFSMILKNQTKRSGKPPPKPRRKTGREVVKKS